MAAAASASLSQRQALGHGLAEAGSSAALCGDGHTREGPGRPPDTGALLGRSTIMYVSTPLIKEHPFHIHAADDMQTDTPDRSPSHFLDWLLWLSFAAKNHPPQRAPPPPPPVQSLGSRAADMSWTAPQPPLHSHLPLLTPRPLSLQKRIGTFSSSPSHPSSLNCLLALFPILLT